MRWPSLELWGTPNMILNKVDWDSISIKSIIGTS